MITAVLIAAADASVTVTSAPFTVGRYNDISIQVDFTGSNLAGTLTYEGSNTGVNYISVAASSTAIASSAPNVLYNLTGINYLYIRVKYTATSGAGTITATLVAKEKVLSHLY